MKLYIANCSKQDTQFTYGLKEIFRPFMQKIRAGAQIVLTHNLDEVNHIIAQHAIYGMQEVGKIKKGFGGLCYRLDKPINVEAIESGFTQTEQEQIDRALEARKYTAAAADKMLNDKAQELGLRQKSALEVETIEDSKGPMDENQKFGEVIEVVKEGAPPIQKGRGRPRK